MITKPSTCQTCPWYQTGTGFVPDEQHDSEVFILTSNPGKTEVECGQPACGRAGKDMDYHFLPLAGLERGTSVTVGTVLKCQWNNSHDLPHDANQRIAVEDCTAKHLRIPKSTKLIIAQGELAFEYAHSGKLTKANGRPASITNWRGFLLPLEFTQPRFGSVPVYVCLDPESLYSNPGMETVTEWDWTKVKEILHGRYPKPIPASLVAGLSVYRETMEWFQRARGATWITCDTEYIPGPKLLTIIGLLARYPDGRLEGLQCEWRSAHAAIKQIFYREFKGLVQSTPFVFFNARADIPVLEKVFGCTWEDYKHFDDVMLAHAVLWCELPHTLEFVCSQWGQYPKLKQLKSDDEMLYNFGDVLETDSAWQHIVESSFKYDTLAKGVYESQHIKLAPLVERTVQRGLRVNHTRVLAHRHQLESSVIKAQQLATACAGWPINLNSSRQLSWYLYDIRGFTPETHKDSGNTTTDDAAIARLRMALGPAFDPNDDLTYEQALTRIEQGADPILEARVLYAGAQTRLIKYIYPLYQVVADVQEFNYPTKGAYDKARTSAIESVLSGVETALLERIHPDMLIHSQKTGRWSTVDPPIAQLPIELRDLVCPDRDEVWISWDWSAIEPRVLEALCGSRILRRAFDEGIDLHTWTVCVIFNYEFPVNLIDPHKSPECAEWRKKYDWRGKDDPRRVFAKTGRYEMYYGGTGGNAADAAALFGLDPKVLRKALGALLTADPEYYSWRLHLESALKNTRVVRTFMGRPRRFLKGGQKMIREGLDQPMQGAVSDIFNTTVILGSQVHPRVQFAWGMHDSQKWHCPIEMAEEMKGVLKRIAERPFTINNKQVVFPVDIELIYPPERSVSHGNAH